MTSKIFWSPSNNLDFSHGEPHPFSIAIHVTIETFVGWFIKKNWSPIDGQPKHFSVTNHCYLMLFAIEFLVAMCKF
jgi:hypothetical protein